VPVCFRQHRASRNRGQLRVLPVLLTNAFYFATLFRVLAISLPRLRFPPPRRKSCRIRTSEPCIRKFNTINAQKQKTLDFTKNFACNPCIYNTSPQRHP
jgi:hypothetical protein